MPRRGQIAKRDVLPDPMYNSKLVTRLVNNVMYDGKKGVAQKIVYGAFEIIAEKTGKDALEAFQEAMENIMPVLEVKARRVGGSNYQVPIEVRPERRQTLGLRWLVKYTRARGEKGMVEKLAKEIMDAANNTGASVKKKEAVNAVMVKAGVEFEGPTGTPQLADKDGAYLVKDSSGIRMVQKAEFLKAYSITKVPTMNGRQFVHE